MELNIGDRVSWIHDPELKGKIISTNIVRVGWDVDPEVDFDYPVADLMKEDS